MNKQILTWLMLLAVVFCLVPSLSHARWYDPQTGQWVSVDPAFDFPGNFGNPHAYVGQNPINRIDPMGAMTLNECVMTLATRSYMVYDQYSNFRDIVDITHRVATGESVKAYEVALLLWSILPNSPNPPKVNHLPLVHGRHLVPDDEIKAINEGIRRYAPALRSTKEVGDFGETVLKQRGVARGLEPISKSWPGRHGYDAVFKQGDKIVIGEAKAGALESINWSKRTFGHIPKELRGTLGDPPYVQGTKAWVVDYAWELKNKGISLGDEILEKVKTGDVLWYEVRTKIKDGTVLDVVEEVRALD